MSDVSTEPVTGWRLWRLATAPPGIPVLLPAGAGRGMWPARRRFEARCSTRGGFTIPLADVRHDSPSLGCTCGIYASVSLEHLVASTPSVPPMSVVGTVSMWGQTIEHEHGWRSRFAYPARLILVCAECLRSGSGDGTPATVVLSVDRHRMRELIAFCADHRDMIVRRESLPLLDARGVQDRLLNRYAVDPLPFDTVRTLFDRPRAAAPAQQWPPAIAPPASPVVSTPTKDPLWRRAARAVGEAVSFCIGLAFVAIMSIGWLQSCIVTVDPEADAVVPTAEPQVVMTDPSRPASESSRRVRPEPFPRLEFVCGRPHGGWIELAECSPDAPLVGFAASPPDDSCIGKPEAITMRPGYTICWESLGDPVAVDPHAVAANPFVEEAARAS